MRKIIFTICIAALLVFFWRQHSKYDYANASVNPPEATDTFYAPSIDEAPYQSASDAGVFMYKDVKLKPLYDFIVTARVLSKKNYSDHSAKYAPTDLALGWKKMADNAIIEQLNISQGNRWFYWRTDTAPPISTKEITRTATNAHLIPSNAAVKVDIDRIKVGQIVQISGKLVNMHDEKNGRYWNSSTSREDSGSGACELIFVEAIDIIEP